MPRQFLLAPPSIMAVGADHGGEGWHRIHGAGANCRATGHINVPEDDEGRSAASSMNMPPVLPILSSGCQSDQDQPTEVTPRLTCSFGQYN